MPFSVIPGDIISEISEFMQVPIIMTVDGDIITSVDTTIAVFKTSAGSIHTMKNLVLEMSYDGVRTEHMKDSALYRMYAAIKSARSFEPHPFIFTKGFKNLMLFTLDKLGRVPLINGDLCEVPELRPYITSTWASNLKGQGDITEYRNLRSIYSNNTYYEYHNTLISALDSNIPISINYSAPYSDRAAKSITELMSHKNYNKVTLWVAQMAKNVEVLGAESETLKRVLMRAKYINRVNVTNVALIPHDVSTNLISIVARSVEDAGAICPAVMIPSVTRVKFGIQCRIDNCCVDIETILEHPHLHELTIAIMREVMKVVDGAFTCARGQGKPLTLELRVKHDWCGHAPFYDIVNCDDPHSAQYTLEKTSHKFTFRSKN